jgi:hypothetical protein
MKKLILLENTFKKEMPNPTEEDMDSDAFNAIWDIIKNWDVNVPDYYSGYCGANGSHVKLILDELNKRKCLNKRKEKLERILKEE